MQKLKIILSTIRPERKGPVFGNWIFELARQYGEFEVELLDLAVINLPLMNERSHPKFRNYEHEHTRRWSQMIDEADAFIFVTAEYDFNYPAPLRNALEYLFIEWNCKPAGIVSYGSVSAGTRAANNLKSDLASLKMVPLFEMVNIPFFSKSINDKGEFVPNGVSTKAAGIMLKELDRWGKGLKTIREMAVAEHA